MYRICCLPGNQMAFSAQFRRYGTLPIIGKPETTFAHKKLFKTLFSNQFILDYIPRIVNREPKQHKTTKNKDRDQANPTPY